ncbi:MAG: hypothetical protein P9L97_12880 [Candidatus Tenebribacter davisii]|jgi:hypothetical protein|nr:hypothetical protein [Candidatus Tenebribacter davisii]
MKSLELNYEYEVKEKLELDYISENYGVDIIGNDSSKALIEISAKVKHDTWINDDLKKIVKCDFDKKHNMLTIKTNEEDDIQNIKIIVHVPKKTLINAKTENAHLLLRELIGSHQVQNENGPIFITDNLGDIQIKSENGPIKIIKNIGNIVLTFENGPLSIKNSAGKFKVISENSPIKIGNCQGELILNTENSSIKILKAGFDVVAISNENGSIYYEFQDVEKGKFNFKNQMGGIHLVIPDEIPYKIAAKNKLGKFYVGLKGDYDGLEKGLNVGNEKNLNMVKGAGTVKITAENEYGTIRLVDTARSKKSFDFNFVGDIIDNSMKNVPEDYSETVRKGMGKAKEVMKNIDIPNVNEIMENVQDKMKDIFVKVSSSELKEQTEEKINEGISKVVQEVHERVKDRDLTENEQIKVDERSRLKILQMLSEGKITADEAEKLITAMEGK